MNIKLLTITILAGIVFVVLFSSGSAYAKTAQEQFEGGIISTGDKAGYADSYFLDSIEETIGRGIRVLLSGIGILFFSYLVWGGFIWMKAIGNEQEVTRAKNIIKNASLGLAIVVAAYGITMIAEGLIVSTT